MWLTVALATAQEAAAKLVMEVHAELEVLRRDGPTAAQVAAFVETERRAMETERQHNSYWLAAAMEGYVSRRYTGDVGQVVDESNAMWEVRAVHDADDRWDC